MEPTFRPEDVQGMAWAASSTTPQAVLLGRQADGLHVAGQAAVVHRQHRLGVLVTAFSMPAGSMFMVAGSMSTNLASAPR